MNELDLFAAAIAVADPAERVALLDRECAGAPAKRVRLEALLRAHDWPDSLLDHPAVAPHDPDTATTRTIGHEGASADDEVPLGFLAPATRPDSLGRIGHYEVLQVLGQGGFGIVFRAFDDVLQRVVAVKVLAPQLAATSPARKRFLREARTSAAVRHENVVQVYEVGETPLPYIVMEFIPGETLQQRLDRIGPIEPAEVVRIGRQIAEGLAAAHATDLIHRDIKPGNVLLEGGVQRVKITDFGLARAADDASISQSGIIAGTPMYMAPEQAKGEILDQRADLFSLGSVLYQMASGRSPFRANSTVAVLKRVAEDTPRDIREIIPETPQWLCDIIAKLHAKNPDDRFQSAREVADVLADCEAQLKAHAKVRDFSRIPQSKPAARASGRWKWVAVAALLLPVLALALTEVTGVTHLFGTAGQQQPPLDRTKNGGDVPGMPLVPATANDLPLVAVGPTDMIPFARPDLSRGRWEVRDGKLVHPARGEGEVPPAMPLAVRGPDEFDLEAVFERTAGNDFLAFGMSARGRRFGVVLDTGGHLGRWAGVSDVNGAFTVGNPTMRKGPWLTTGRRHTLRCEVRASGIRAWLDGREVADYRDGYEALSANPLGLPTWTQFFLHTNDDCAVVVHKLVLTPFSPAPEDTNTLGMKFKLIPAGKFTMGSSQEEIDRCVKIALDQWAMDCVQAEAPEHPVEITQPFYMGATEVTVGQFQQFVEEEGYQVGDARWRNPGFDQTDKHPVVWVTWNNAVDFCKWLSAKEGKEYRLPTEAEWEYSCRAGKTGSRYCFGDDEAQLENYAWYNKNAGGGTHPVGKKKPNDWGLYDMHGNVWELCQDKYDPDYYKTCPAKDPPGPGAGGVWRGGSWRDPPERCRSACRNHAAPGHRDHICGFRVALSVSPPAGGRTGGEAKDKPSSPASAPFTDADVQRIAALPAPQQVEEVRKELKRRNSGFDGKVEHKIEDGVVTEFKIVTDQVTDISPIRVFNALRVLECSGTWTNKRNGLLADLTPLKGMNLTGLTHLGLGCTKVTDGGIVYFKDCKNLTALYLDGTKVTDGGMVYFKDCKNLTHLRLDGTQVGDAGLIHFQDCKDLTYLNLSYTQVSNVGLAHFKDCKNLTGLHLDTTQVTDAGLADIAGLEQLTELNLAKTKVTAKGVEGLAKTMPKCKIVWDGGTIAPKVSPRGERTPDAAAPDAVEEGCRQAGLWPRTVSR